MKNENWDVERIKEFTKKTLQWHKKLIKPWKLGHYGIDSQTQQDYTDGWNDCLKEMEKNHKSLMKFCEEQGFFGGKESFSKEDAERAL